ncbi:MAG: flagellin [Methanophagales archaeon ANME-1-THS]|nr:MAG: flagellin [Methanophagales archaeon ANME-1-THS]
MNTPKRSIRKDTRAFTGLEAAIVLTAFVVVAAVFSYVMLNAGFFTTQKSKEVIHTGVEQATSSAQLTGNVIGHGWQYGYVNGSGLWNTTGYRTYYAWGYSDDSDKYQADTTNLTVVEFYVQLSAGEQPLSLASNQLTIGYSDVDTHVGSLTYADNANASSGNMSMGCWNYSWVRGDGDVLLEVNEQAKIMVTLPDYGVTATKSFTIEFKPAIGATLGITRAAPASIHKTDIVH